MIKLVETFMAISLFVTVPCLAQDKTGNFELKAPDGVITVQVSTATQTQWSVDHKGQPIIRRLLFLSSGITG
jgi:hypothetical protein